jgi:hypothetical protein
MKEIPGKRYRTLVERAKYQRHTQKMFLEDLTVDEAKAIERMLKVGPKQFWRAARGTAFIHLPPREVQLELEFPE